MTSPNQYGMTGDGPSSAEATLRLIAGLPAPEGLADRVHTRLRTVPRKTGLLHWPLAPAMGFRIYSPVFRAAAAAGIVCLVAGGGWQIYSHVATTPAGSAVVQPARIGNSGGFSNAGAMRTPDTLDRPVLKQAVPAAGSGPAAGAGPAARHRAGAAAEKAGSPENPAAPSKKHKSSPKKHQATPLPQ